MANEDIIRRLTITGDTTALDRAAVSSKNLADGTNILATATDTSAKRALSAEAAYNKLTQSIDPAARAQAQIAKATKTANDALEQGYITQTQYAKAVEGITKKYTEQAAANDNTAKGFHSTGLEVASVANHIKHATEAAFALSPAFRAMVAENVRPALGLVGSGLAAVGAAGVAATNFIGRGFISAAASVAAFHPALAPVATGLAAIGTSMAGFTLSATGLFGGLLARIMGWLGPLAAIYTAAKLIAFAWTSASEEIEKYNKLSNDATALNMTVNEFQRVTKSAEDAGVKIDSVTASLAKLKDVSKDQLGGSTLWKKIDALQDAGNLTGSQGVEDLKNATTLQMKWDAILQIVKDAHAKGEDLAAIDLVKTFAPPEMVDALEKNRDLFDTMGEKAKEIQATRLAKQEDVDIANSLNQRMEAATKILSERWIPFQTTINALGTGMHMVWVSIVETIASGMTYLSKFVSYIWDANAAAVATAKTFFGLDAAKVGPLDAATQGLRTGLANKNNVTKSFDDTNSLSNALRPDQSKPILEATTKAANNARDALDRAEESLLKYIKTTDAAALSVGKGAFEIEKLKAVAILMAAAEKEQITVTDELAAKFEKLADRAGAAARELAKAKAVSNADFNRKTAFLSPEDVQIANELKEIYGNDIPTALGSSDAAAIRLNNTFKDINDTIRSAASSFANNFVGALVSGKSASDALMGSLSSLGKELTSAGIKNIIKDPASVVGYIEAGIGIITSLFTGASEKRKKEEEARRIAAEKEAAAVAAAAERSQQFNDRAKLAGVDTSTLAGQLQAFDISAAKERRDEAAAGNRSIIALEAALAAERKAIVDKSNAAIMKSMNDFLEQLKTGSNSILSPEDKLKYQQGVFEKQYSAAKGGDADALGKITQTASALLDLAKGFYASSAEYTSIYKNVTDDIGSLATKKFALGGAIGHYALGGSVGNGIHNVDSVMATYAGGGNIALAGGEYVTRAGSVNSNTKQTLEYINKTGSVPNSNGGNNGREIISVLTQGFNGQTKVLENAINGVSDRVKRLEDTTRQTANQRRVPGTKAA